MGQEYLVRYKTNRDEVKKYLLARKFPVDESDKKTLIIASEDGKVDCWLSWRGMTLEIASQIFDTQSAWCATIANRLIDLFPCDRVGSDSSGWWDIGERPGKPFSFTMKIFKENKEEIKRYKKLQCLFIKEGLRLLPDKEKI